jgi:iron complex outermembrane receptor protein
MTQPASFFAKSLLVTIASISFAASAQEGDTLSNDSSEVQPILEEVIVTAQRREEPLQSVPISVTVISGDRIREGEIMTVSDVAVETPNFVFTQFNIGEPVYSIRGIGSTNDSAGSDPSVGVFIDDVYIGRTGGMAMELFDLERVEVLRGPQGTLFGKNVVGGAVSIHTQTPSDEFVSRWGLTDAKRPAIPSRA